MPSTSMILFQGVYCNSMFAPPEVKQTENRSGPSVLGHLAGLALLHFGCRTNLRVLNFGGRWSYTDTPNGCRCAARSVCSALQPSGGQVQCAKSKRPLETTTLTRRCSRSVDQWGWFPKKKSSTQVTRYPLDKLLRWAEVSFC